MKTKKGRTSLPHIQLLRLVHNNYKLRWWRSGTATNALQEICKLSQVRLASQRSLLNELA